MSNDNYYLLDDMEKYCPNFKRDKYEDKSKETLIPIFREYYASHLPVDVTTWIRVNEPSKDLIYKEGSGKQIVFLRDVITRGLFYSCENGNYDHEKYDSFQPKVISTHTSKSVTLPVMKICLPSVGVEMIFRNNFYDWNVSIKSEKFLDFDHKGLINDDRDCFYQGFPDEWKFGNYNDNHKQFTICIGSDYDLYAFMFLLKDYLYGSTK